MSLFEFGASIQFNVFVILQNKIYCFVFLLLDYKQTIKWRQTNDEIYFHQDRINAYYCYKLTKSPENETCNIRNYLALT